MAREVDGTDRALVVDEERARRLRQSEAPGEWAAPSLPVVYLRPGDLMILDERPERRGVPVDPDAQDRQSFPAVLVGERLQGWEIGAGLLVPGRPEIDQQHLSPVALR